MVFAGLPLIPLLNTQLGTIEVFTSHSTASYVPSKLDAELLSEAENLLVDLQPFDRECSDRCLLRPMHLSLHVVP